MPKAVKRSQESMRGGQRASDPEVHAAFWYKRQTLNDGVINFCYMI